MGGVSSGDPKPGCLPSAGGQGWGWGMGRTSRFGEDEGPASSVCWKKGVGGLDSSIQRWKGWESKLFSPGVEEGDWEPQLRSAGSKKGLEA